MYDRLKEKDAEEQKAIDTVFDFNFLNPGTVAKRMLLDQSFFPHLNGWYMLFPGCALEDRPVYVKEIYPENKPILLKYAEMPFTDGSIRMVWQFQEEQPNEDIAVFGFGESDAMLPSDVPPSKWWWCERIPRWVANLTDWDSKRQVLVEKESRRPVTAQDLNLGIVQCVLPLFREAQICLFFPKKVVV